MLNNKIIKISEKVYNDPSYKLSDDEIKVLVSIEGDDLIDLFACANKIRTKHKNDKIYTCSIINAKSGSCSEDCAFCAQSAHHNTNVQTYELLSEGELVNKALRMEKAGATQYSFVTSGYAVTDNDIEIICSAAKKIKSQTNLSLCASLGMLTSEKAKALKAAGISNYHHNLETSRSYFSEICTTHDYDEDIETVKFAQSVGMDVCCGFIAGLGESWDDRIEIFRTLQELDIHAIPVNFLNPVKGTKLENNDLVDPLDALKIIAICRIMNPTKNIGICGGREVTLKDFQSWIFAAGANGFMVGDYLTTKGRNMDMDMNMIKDLGLKYEQK